MGLGDSVRFMGVSERINECMQAMDVFVFPSLFEGLGIALVEAQASGLPCLASADVIPKDVARTARVAFVSLGDPAARWAEVALKHAADSGERSFDAHSSMGDYDIHHAVSGLEHLYLETPRHKDVLPSGEISIEGA